MYIIGLPPGLDLCSLQTVKGIVTGGTTCYLWEFQVMSPVLYQGCPSKGTKGYSTVRYNLYNGAQHLGLHFLDVFELQTHPGNVIQISECHTSNFEVWHSLICEDMFFAQPGATSLRIKKQARRAATRVRGESRHFTVSMNRSAYPTV